jgi:ABC-2 type transport system permease protein
VSRAVLFARTLRDQRVACISVAFVMALMAVLDTAIYPEYRDALEKFELPAYFQGFVGEAGSIASPEGFYSAEFFSWLPLLLITVVIIGATGTLAGEEAAGTLDLLLAQPVKRSRLLLEKTAGLTVITALAAAASIPGFAVAKAFVDVPIGVGRLSEATANMVPVTLLYLTLSLWAAAALPSRSMASLVAIGAVVAAYILNTVGAAVPAIEDVRNASPFYWADSAHVLVHGFDWPRAAGMLALSGVFLGLALWSFERRDLTAGAREWSLRRLLRRPGREPTPGAVEAVP